MVKKKKTDPQETEHREEETMEAGAETPAPDAGAQELEACRQQLVRMQADFDNYRKRMMKEQTRVYQDAVEGFVLNLLPVLDDLERAIHAAKKQSADKNLLTGVEMIHRRLRDVLDKEGITPIECVGKPFDPECHQAVQRICVPDQPENTVVEEAQRGYQRQDRVIRPSMVVVSTQDEE